MDLRIYYQKIRDLERQVEDDHVVVVSLETPDGGTAGVLTEVPTKIAARMVIDGRARLSRPEEAKEFHERKAEAKRQVEEQAAASRLQLSVVPLSELERLRSKGRPDKN